MRSDIAFKAEDGTTLRGWHYLPDQRAERLPTIVMAHGFSGVKEMFMDKFAEAFAAAGFDCLAYDNRNFGRLAGAADQRARLGAAAGAVRHDRWTDRHVRG